MNRIDRLYAMAEQLRAVAPRYLSAASLAERFEVSTRTVERDILALQETGVPIWSTPGPGGGYAVDPEMSLPPVNFTAAEATAVAVALATGDTPFADVARSAMVKLASAMSATERDAAEELAGRITVMGEPTRGRSDAVVSSVAAAVAGRHVIELDYVDREGRPSTRRPVEAHGLAVTTEGVWYLVAWCRLRDDERIFRLDRIVAVHSTAEIAPGRPIGEPPFPSLSLRLVA